MNKVHDVIFGGSFMDLIEVGLTCYCPQQVFLKFLFTYLFIYVTF